MGGKWRVRLSRAVMGAVAVAAVGCGTSGETDLTLTSNESAEVPAEDRPAPAESNGRVHGSAVPNEASRCAQFEQGDQERSEILTRHARVWEVRSNEQGALSKEQRALSAALRKPVPLPDVMRTVATELSSITVALEPFVAETTLYATIERLPEEQMSAFTDRAGSYVRADLVEKLETADGEVSADLQAALDYLNSTELPVIAFSAVLADVTEQELVTMGSYDVALDGEDALLPMDAASLQERKRACAGGPEE